MTTAYPGASTADMCACPEGTYDPRPFGGGVKCEPCPDGIRGPENFTDCNLRQGARHLKGTYKGEFFTYALNFFGYF